MDLVSLIPIPLFGQSLSIISELLHVRTLEENIILFQTRSQHIISLSTISAFLAAVQAQFISFTYQKNDKPLEKAANVCFVLGVSLNVIGATASLMATSSLPSPTKAQDDLVAFRKAVEEAETIFELINGPDATDSMVIDNHLKSWGKRYHHHITHMLSAGNLIAQWNVQRLIYSFVMQTGVGAFFLGLIFFIINTQPRAVWLPILLTSLISWMLIEGVKTASSFQSIPFGPPDQRPFIRQILSGPKYIVEGRRSRDMMVKRQAQVSTIYTFCSEKQYV